MKAYAIETRRVGARFWGTLKPSSVIKTTEFDKNAALAFETRAEAQTYLDAHRPPGYEARITEVGVDPLSFHGRHDA